METKSVKDGKKKQALTIVEKGQNVTEKNKTKKGLEKNNDEQDKVAKTKDVKNENLDKMVPTKGRKKNTVTASICAFFRMFSCKIRQEKDNAVV